MKKFFLCLTLAFVCVSYAGAASSDTCSDVTKWVESLFAKGKEPPFSFVLDGRHSSGFIRGWKWSRTPGEMTPDGAVPLTYSYADPSGKLVVKAEVRIWRESRAVEWTVKVKNISGKDSGRISNLECIDTRIKFPTKGEIILHGAEGNLISKSDYSPHSRVLPDRSPIYLCPQGGRSSEGAFPFFNIESPLSGEGLVLAVGWTGTWLLDVCKVSGSSVNIRMGQKTLDTYLMPSEEIRAPSVALLFWKGDRMDGHNAFRRFVICHHSRKVDGKVDYPLCSGFNYRDPKPFGEYSAITSDWAIAMIERYALFGIVPDVFWLDAGWHTGASDYMHGQSWATTTGNWTVDRERFPEGLRPVSEAAHKAGAKFMVWFEPERVVRGTQWSVEHPEWMLEASWPEGSEESTWQLFNLADDDACRWLCGYIGDMIEENGIDYYRQDCNIKPEKYWAAADKPGREGMTENRYVCNLYRFWDSLLDRFPGLLIDNCASGGKRLDWETIGRSAPLWRDDYYHLDDPDGYQCHTYGLNYFLPIHGTGILKTDEYSFRSSLSSTLIYNWKITEKGWSVIDMQKRIAEYRGIKPYYYEDYYPLSGEGDLTGEDIWLAYQMHRPSDGSGIIVAFRRENASESDYAVKLGGIDADSDYLLTDSDSGNVSIVPGRQLADGYVLHLEATGSSLLLKYERK